MNKLLPKHFLACLYMGMLLLVFSGCKRAKTVTRAELPEAPPVDNVVSIREQLNAQQPDFKWLRMRSTIDYVSPDSKYNVNANFRIKKDEIFWGSVNMLIEVVRAQITPDSAVLLNRMEKSYSTMKPDDLQKIIAIEGLDLKALQNLVLAQPPFGIREGTKLEKNENDTYFLSNTGSLFKEEFELDARSLKLKNYRFEKNSTQSVTVNYDDFKQVESLLLPQKIVFNIASPEKITLTLNVTDYLLLDADEAPFSIPASYKKAQ